MKFIRTTNKDLNKILRQLRKWGWTIERVGTGHVRVMNRDGRIAVLSSSCSDARGILNAKSDLRKLGAPV
jgi:hypothetical protein